MLPVEPGGQPYVIDQSTGEVRNPLSEFAPGRFQGWHPDSRHFLFVVDGGGPWLVNAGTSEIIQLALDSVTQGAVISPDGLTVAYIGNNPSATDGVSYALWFVSSAGSDSRLQFDAGPQAYLYLGAWSPDGNGIVYVGNCSELGKTNPLCLFNPSTGQRWALNIPSFAGINTAWSPNSQYVAVTGFVRGEQRCEGGELSPLEQEACQFDDGHIIYIDNTLTNESLQLASGIAPVWSPDGSILAFISKRSGTPEVWTIRIDGTNLKQLTTDRQDKSPYSLTWSAEVGQ
jgi:Tol biopolymer transport system component